LLFSISQYRCYGEISKKPDFLAIATLPVNMEQASPLTVREEKSYYIIKVKKSNAFSIPLNRTKPASNDSGQALYIMGKY
jgi:hypothetical protein